MKKLLLLPFLFSTLLFSGCQHPDDDVDLPKPQKPVAVRIAGPWDEGGNVYEFGEDTFFLLYNGEQNDQASGDFSMTQKGGKTFITIRENATTVGEYETYEITTASDSTMTWQASTWSDDTGEVKVEREFRKRKVVDNWRKISTTKITYNAAGKVLKTKVQKHKDVTYFFDYNYMAITSEDDFNMAYYTLKYTADGKTHLSIEGNNNVEAMNVEVAFPKENHMRWIQKKSATISYITEFVKEKR